MLRRFWLSIVTSPPAAARPVAGRVRQITPPHWCRRPRLPLAPHVPLRSAPAAARRAPAPFAVTLLSVAVGFVLATNLPNIYPLSVGAFMGLVVAILKCWKTVG